ncbi:hypothetical protein PHLGIDRAFT_341591 [Phlebiopsis gigantea 11061_1 CR5-6]|uniref:Uncharacterized protein n=1 Tax=Phlebiopsis gigantea (strain 11061_1 CR5-6) TaxID=745531 RepID=A0A0C3PA51_PHLG1|nr:hypothetical protein PHLGIDRAFT_341591 [Phlebiopsis gigantea 11061_1 CR5-6]
MPDDGHRCHSHNCCSRKTASSGLVIPGQLGRRNEDVRHAYSTPLELDVLTTCVRSICRCVHPSPGRREPLASQHRDCQQDTRVAKKPGDPSGSRFLGRWLTLGHLLAGGHVARVF